MPTKEEELQSPGAPIFPLDEDEGSQDEGDLDEEGVTVVGGDIDLFTAKPPAWEDNSCAEESSSSPGSNNVTTTRVFEPPRIVRSTTSKVQSPRGSFRRFARPEVLWYRYPEMQTLEWDYQRHLLMTFTPTTILYFVAVSAFCLADWTAVLISLLVEDYDVPKEDFEKSFALNSSRLSVCVLITILYIFVKRIRTYRNLLVLLYGLYISMSLMVEAHFAEFMGRPWFVGGLCVIIGLSELKLGMPAVHVCILSMTNVITFTVFWGTSATDFSMVRETILLGVVAIFFTLMAYRAEVKRRLRFSNVQQLERERWNLGKENTNLRKKLSELVQADDDSDIEDGVDIDAPVEKMVSTLIELRDRALEWGGDSESTEAIDFVIKTLSSHRPIYEPNISDQLHNEKNEVDSDIKRWLLDNISSRGNASTAGTANTPQFRRSMLSFVDLEKRKADGTLSLSGSQNLFVEGETEIKSFIKKIVECDTWDVDFFEVDSVSNGKALSVLSRAIFDRLQLFEKFKIDKTHFENFVSAIESAYHPDNPYHNHIHAADVLFSTYWIVRKTKVGQYLTSTDVVTMLIAAMIHDVDHPGVSNNYLIKTGANVALLHNDQSVLENHHLCTAFTLLKEPDKNILKNISQENYEHLRRTVIEVVLATDISSHFALLSQFKVYAALEEVDHTALENRRLSMKTIVHMCDVSNPSKQPAIAKRWTDAVMEEFYRQGDKERDDGLEISPFMDRKNPTVAKCQLGFINYIVLPLFESMQIFVGSEMDVCLDNIVKNQDLWQKELEPPPAAGLPDSPGNKPLLSRKNSMMMQPRRSVLLKQAPGIGGLRPVKSFIRTDSGRLAGVDEDDGSRRNRRGSFT